MKSILGAVCRVAPCVLAPCVLALCVGCAPHPQQVDEDGQSLAWNGGGPGSGSGGGPGGGSGGGPGGGNSIWSDVLHMAMQTGMGMLHK